MNKAQKVKGALQGILRPDNGVIDIFLARSRHPQVVEALARYDPQLILYYDKAAAKYGLARLTPGGIRFICLWQDEKTGVALPVDMRILDAVHRWDLRPARVGAPKSANALAAQREREHDERQQKTERSFDDDIGHLTRDNRHRLNRVLGSIT